ncbi:type II toxin-antitoxin system RelE/ParE family toxin [Methylopila sp. 73B]|uniref:type II toxin-antitoxin system RelE/ParE family toxin n=1 Tax=Methylopila sp. 73B TaxID=1120792 RepID=UPI0003688168|nr:type II toxin-antitoxin system RelE/ParE family toxin [Methylopila sp. 73B]
MNARLTRRAARDIREIGGYLKSQNPSAAARVEQALWAAIRVIEEHPHAGRLQERGVRRFSVSRFPYLIFYRIDVAAGSLDVLTIRHGARRPIIG